MITLADYDGTTEGAGVFVGFFILLLWLFGTVYAIFTFFVPFYVYRIMRRQTENNEVLLAILNEIRLTKGRLKPAQPPPIPTQPHQLTSELRKT
jgi:hypothetical protein